MKHDKQELSPAEYWEKVNRARQMSPEERMLEGVRMFDRECEAMRLEIVKDNPNFSELEVSQEIRRRLDEMDSEDGGNLYQTIPPDLR